MPEKEKIPAWKTLEECLAYSREKKDGFYIDVFMFEVWIGMIIEKTVAQYAENKSGHRHLQTGTSWQAWQETFRHAKPGDWNHILDSLGRYATCDTPESAMVAKVLALVATEDQHAEPVMLSTHMARAANGKMALDEMLERMRYFFQRMAEWMEALVHWKKHRMANAVPLAFGATEEQRELACVGLMQAGFAGLNEHGRDWWMFRHEELAEKFAGRPEWRLVGKAQSLEKFGKLRQPAVDELTIHWWPLLVRYRWTDHDLRILLKRVVPHPYAYPLREDKEFADYRKKVLGLIKAKKERDKSAPNGKPTGWRAALAMIDRLPD